jgi:hypothetical protein
MFRMTCDCVCSSYPVEAIVMSGGGRNKAVVYMYTCDMNAAVQYISIWKTQIGSDPL